ncbi:hypothetical protein CYMTET_56302 [Cymbomonas tetramitiformis]|uniref:Uncharacterized protein n=1 Tax=Cymbomonas tetramitiformis TaxID=36881 RepID=A0AAE0BBK0_9CHLO|nr:hypothetical protein CYMTET_56302 [Cymbomonas tetramitiformis]
MGLVDAHMLDVGRSRKDLKSSAQRSKRRTSFTWRRTGRSRQRRKTQLRRSGGPSVRCLGRRLAAGEQQHEQQQEAPPSLMEDSAESDSDASRCSSATAASMEDLITASESSERGLTEAENEAQELDREYMAYLRLRPDYDGAPLHRRGYKLSAEELGNYADNLMNS